jgi:type VI secretion system protein ImpI
MPLEVKVSEPVKQQQERTLRFSQSPVRIGRNQLNDISLDDPFVSEWHGILRFDEAGAAYFDLGSTNGTVLGGKRLPKNAPVALTETSRLSIGRIDITVRIVRAEAGQAKTMMGLSASSGPAPTGGAHTGGGPSAAPASTGSSPPSSSGSAARWDAPAAVPAGDRRAATGSSSAANAATPPPEVAAGAEPVAARRARILQAFFEGLVGLKNGYEQFGREVGVRTINGMTPLRKARTSRDVGEHLLNPAVDTDAAIHDLLALFADFGIHHIAMMEGVTEGVRAVLQSLDPRAGGLGASPGLWTKARNKELWKEYVDRYDQLVNDDNELHAMIFGDDFARAYATVTIGDKAADKTGGNGRKGR